MSAMKAVYLEMLKTVKECRIRLQKVRQEYESSRDIFQAQCKDLEKLYAQFLLQKKTEEILQLLEDAKKLENHVEELMQKKKFCFAIEQLKFLDTILYKTSLAQLKVLDDMRQRTMQRLQTCHQKVSIDQC